MLLETMDIKITAKGAEKLTMREQQVLLLIASGVENKQIVRILGISMGTVLAYVQQVYEKLDVSNRDINPRPAAVTVSICKGLLLIGDKCGCHAAV
jgi:DNA-binding NarL/FixJ family response regulator